MSLFEAGSSMSSVRDSMVDWLDLDTVLLPRKDLENNTNQYK
jgi:hypothetical protein